MILDLKIEYGIIFISIFLKSIGLISESKYGSHYKAVVQVKIINFWSWTKKL